VLWSIPLVALLYIGLNLAILGVLPWQQGMQSKAIVADFMAAIYGPIGGRIVTVLILIASWASALMNLLGASRVPCRRPRRGFLVFARTNARGDVPAVSLLFMGLASALACLVSLDTLIAVMIVVQTMFQYTAQCIAVILLRRQQPQAAPASSACRSIRCR
jgi:amino acid transporter